MSVTASLTAFDSINKRGFKVVGFNDSFDGAVAVVVVEVVVLVGMVDVVEGAVLS